MSYSGNSLEIVGIPEKFRDIHQLLEMSFGRFGIAYDAMRFCGWVIFINPKTLWHTCKNMENLVGSLFKNIWIVLNQPAYTRI